jgi:hypothetical protein
MRTWNGWWLYIFLLFTTVIILSISEWCQKSLFHFSHYSAKKCKFLLKWCKLLPLPQWYVHFSTKIRITIQRMGFLLVYLKLTTTKIMSPILQFNAKNENLRKIKSQIVAKFFWKPRFTNSSRFSNLKVFRRIGQLGLSLWWNNFFFRLSKPKKYLIFRYIDHITALIRDKFGRFWLGGICIPQGSRR